MVVTQGFAPAIQNPAYRPAGNFILAAPRRRPAPPLRPELRTASCALRCAPPLDRDVAPHAIPPSPIASPAVAAPRGRSEEGGPGALFPAGAVAIPARPGDRAWAGLGISWGRHGRRLGMAWVWGVGSYGAGSGNGGRLTELVLANVRPQAG